MSKRDYKDAIIAGLLAALIMSTVSWFVRNLGLGFSFTPETVFAALFGFEGSAKAWWFGFVVNMFFGVGFGIVYCRIFEFTVDILNHSFWGLLLGGTQACVLGFLFFLSPRVRELIIAPGAGTLQLSMPDVVNWIFLHLIYGVSVWTIFEEVEGYRRQSFLKKQYAN